MVTDHSPPRADAVSNGGGGISSPQSRRPSLPSPWASVVRGDSEQNASPTAAAAAAAASVAPGSSLSPPPEHGSAVNNSVIESSGSEAQPENSDVNGDANAGRARMPAWNTPLNGVVEPVSVMGGADFWPSLDEVQHGQRSSTDSSRPLVSNGSTSSSQAPVISQPPQRPANNSAHATPAASNPVHNRPRSRNRGGAGGGNSSGSGPAQSSFIRPPPQLAMHPPYSSYEVPYMMVPTVLDTSLRGPRPVGGVGGSQSHRGNDQSSQRNNSRRGNYGPRPRGDGPFHNSQGGRRDQDRRDVYLPPQYVPPPPMYLPAGAPPPPLPPGAVPYLAHPPMSVFPGQMGFEMASPYYVPTYTPDPFRPIPIVPPPPTVPLPPVNEISLTTMIVKQIDYYFSDYNLGRDNFLKSKMDEHGWVPINLIASFRRVERLTRDVAVILDSLRTSTVVEVQGDKVRRRNEWNRFLPSSSSRNSDSGSETPGPAHENALATSLQEASLNDAMPSANGNMDTREGQSVLATENVLHEELSGQSRLANGDGNDEETTSN